MRSRVETSPTTPRSGTPWIEITNPHCFEEPVALCWHCLLCVPFLCHSSSIYLKTTAVHQCPSRLTRRASIPLSWVVRPASSLCRELSAHCLLIWQERMVAIKSRTSPDQTCTQPGRNTWEVNSKPPMTREVGFSACIYGFSAVLIPFPLGRNFISKPCFSNFDFFVFFCSDNDLISMCECQQSENQAQWVASSFSAVFAVVTVLTLILSLEGRVREF